MSAALNGSYGFHDVTVKLFDVTEVKAAPTRNRFGACLDTVRKFEKFREFSW